MAPCTVPYAQGSHHECPVPLPSLLERESPPKAEKAKTSALTPPALGMKDSAAIATLLGQVMNRFESIQKTQETLVAAMVQRKAKCVQSPDARASEFTHLKVACLSHGSCPCKCKDCKCNGPTDDDDATMTSNLSYKKQGLVRSIMQGWCIRVLSNQRDLAKSIKGFIGAVWK